jgi:hypothetical protein
MQLTPEQREKFVSSLRTLWRVSPPKCASCGNNRWEISDRVFEMREFEGGNLVVGGSIYPVIPVTCTQCGQAMFFNALKMGVITSEPSK